MNKTASLLLSLLLGCSQTRAPLTQVDAYVWRSGQPESLAEWQAVKAVGVTDVVQLDFPEEDASYDPRIPASLGITVHACSIEPRGDEDVFDNIANTFKRPAQMPVEEAEAVLAMAGPDHTILVQCRWGHDRTGWTIGRYRVLRNGWSKVRAYQEMLDLGFHPLLRGLQESWEDWNGQP